MVVDFQGNVLVVFVVVVVVVAVFVVAALPWDSSLTRSPFKVGICLDFCSHHLCCNSKSLFNRFSEAMEAS